jgi:hypothetical protein
MKQTKQNLMVLEKVLKLITIYTYLITFITDNM